MKHFLLYFWLLVFSLAATTASAQITVTGKIKTSGGEILMGAIVTEVGQPKGVLSDNEGNFSITVTDVNSKLRFTYIGYAELILPLEGKTTIDATLIESSKSTGEVIVTAAGIERSTRTLGYAVQTVDGETLNKSKETNMVQALAGKIAGVQITQSAGTPGASSSIRIRGTASMTGSYEPLFVIDGIPIDNSETNSDGDPSINNTLQGVNNSNRAIDINPADIENITVLKGPAATALYGIRAGNGAIVITTKKGKRGSKKMTVNYSGDFRLETVNKLPNLQNQYSQGNNGKYLDPTTGSRLSWGALVDSLRYDGIPNVFDQHGEIVGKSDPTAKGAVTPYDNVKDFFQTGRTWDHNVSLSGGGENSGFYASLGHLDQQGIIPNTEFKRTSFRFTVEEYLTSKFKVTGSANYINSTGKRANQGSNLSGIMLGLLRTPITFDNSNGLGKDAVNNPSAYLLDPLTQRNYRGGGGYDNPFYTVNQNRYYDETNRLIGFLQGDYLLTDWAKLTYRVGIDTYTDSRKGGYDYPSRAFPKGRIFDDKMTNKDITSDLILNINKDLGNGLVISGNFGQNFFQSSYERIYTQADGLTIPNLFAISNGSTFRTNQFAAQLQRMGLYGDVTFSYRQRYYLNITGRNDWSSTLEKGHNSFFYPSMNLGYIFTEDLGLNNNKIFNFGKLRFSVAQVGRDAPAYSTRNQFGQPTVSDGYTSGVTFPFNGTGGYIYGTSVGGSYTSLNNPNLRPEINTTLELGTELQFLQNRLKLDVNLYQSTSRDQIVSVNTPSSSGASGALLNAGTLENKGIELSLSGNIVETKEFTWTTTLNYSRNISKVVKLPEGADRVSLVGFAGINSYAIAGQPYGVLYGTDYVKTDDGTLILGKDDGLPIINATPTVIGNPNPTFLLSWRNSFTYKNVSLSVFWDGRFGGKIWNGTRGALNYFGVGGETQGRATDSISFTGFRADANGNATDEKITTKIAKNQNYYNGGIGDGFNSINSIYMEDASWVRLREVSVSYSFPKSWLEPIKLSALSLSFYARNLLLITKYSGVDPETNLSGTTNGFGIDYFNNPNTRSYGVNLRVTF
jgi:TonB-linked SusC/RagA family outer membrane protein